jgi:YspA, cpYpsA-related SLOG family
VTARILWTSSRMATDYDLVRDVIAKVVAEFGPAAVLVHGGAKGGDQLAERAARALGIRTEPHSARWRTEGRAAGPLRNQRMVDAGADVCIALLVAGLPCRGTRDCARHAEAAGIPVRWYTQEAA